MTKVVYKANLTLYPQDDRSFADITNDILVSLLRDNPDCVGLTCNLDLKNHITFADLRIVITDPKEFSVAQNF